MNRPVLYEPLTYSMATTMWHLSHPDGRLARAMIVPRGAHAAVLWCIIGTRQETQRFDTWHQATEHVDQLFQELVAAGWLPPQSKAS